MKTKARTGRQRRSERSAVSDTTRNTTRYLVTSYRNGRESVEINTPDKKRAQRIAQVTAASGVLAVMHQHVPYKGWQPVRHFQPIGGAA